MARALDERLQTATLRRKLLREPDCRCCSAGCARVLAWTPIGRGQPLPQS